MNLRIVVPTLLVASLVIFCGLVSAPDAHAASPEQQAITLYSDGVRLAGDIWHPAGLAESEKRPGILLIHGWGGEKSHLNQAYAPQFAALGYVVLTFDYTGWGESEGMLMRSGARPKSAAGAETTQTYTTEVQEIRRIVNPLEQQDDIRAALAYLVTDPHVDAQRIALWGSSLGGGLALATAIENPQVKVLMTQVGSVNPNATISDAANDPLAPANMTRLRGSIARGTAPSFPDQATPGLKGFPDWPDFVRYNPMDNIEQLQAATLIIDAADEGLFDLQQNGHLLYQRVKDRLAARYETIEGKHYDIYRDTGYQRALKWQTDWLNKHLPVHVR